MVIRDEKGNEEKMLEHGHKSPIVAIVSIITLGIFFYWFDEKKNTALLIDSSIIFNKNKTIAIDDIQIKEIKLSEIITPIIAEETDIEGGKTWNIDLILTNQEKPQRIFRGEDEKEAKALLNSIFNFLDGSNFNSTLSESSTSERNRWVHAQSSPLLVLSDLEKSAKLIAMDKQIGFSNGTPILRAYGDTNEQKGSFYLTA